MYIKQNWVNNVTEVDETHMNHIENGIEKAYGVKLLAVTDEEPSECSVGDKYFNTTTNKIYDAVDTDTWDDEGYDAESGVFYVVFEEQAIYTYNGITLIGVGSSGAGGESLPLGVILAFGGSNAPEGYLLCNGQAVSRTQYSELFNIIGTTYGQGNGTTTFNVPNIKGKVLVGLDANDNDFYTLGAAGGEKTHTLTINEMPSHTHEGLTWTDTDSITLNGGSGTGYNLAFSGGIIAGQENNIHINAKGGGQAHNNLQPYLVVNFIIKATSTTPTTANVVNEESQSTTDTYSCDYVNTQLDGKVNKSQIKTSKTTSNNDTYSCTYANNTFQQKLKTTTKQLTTDVAGNASLNMTANDYLVLSVTQKGTTFNVWTSLYCYGTQYHVHTANLETGSAVSGTGTFEIVYIERANM